MKLNSQVCSFELAKQLKELGVKQDSISWWFPNADKFSLACTFNLVDPINNMYSAFTAAELFELIPYFIDTKKNEPFNGFRFNMTMITIVENNIAKRVFSINYHCDTYGMEQFPISSGKLFKHNIYDENLANSLAKVLIYLIENKLINDE